MLNKFESSLVSNQIDMTHSSFMEVESPFLTVEKIVQAGATAAYLPSHFLKSFRRSGLTNTSWREAGYNFRFSLLPDEVIID